MPLIGGLKRRVSVRKLWLGVIAALILGLGYWLHGAAPAVAEGDKLLLARALIWGSIAAGFGLWLARRQIGNMLLALADRAEGPRRPGVMRDDHAGRFERLLIAAFLATCASVTAVALASPESFIHIFREDGPFETGTTICYFISAAACVALALKARGHRNLQIALGFLATLFFVVGGEEISWGQRMFDFQTPEKLEAVNVQGEFTLHNIYSISLFTYPALAVTATLLLIAPLMRARSKSARRFFDAFEVPVAPPVSAALYAALFAAYVVVGLRLGTPTPLPISYSQYAPHYDDEMMEFLIAALFTVFAVTNWRLRLPGRRASAATEPAEAIAA